MDNELPNNISDIPKLELYNHQRIWSVLKDGKARRLSGALTIKDDTLYLYFECKRKEADKYLSKRTEVMTAKGDEHSRALILNSFATESAFSSYFKNKKARMRLTPNLFIIQGSADRINDKIGYIKGRLPGVAEWFEQDFLDFDFDKYKFKETKTIFHQFELGDVATIKLNAKLKIDIERKFLEGEIVARPESFVQVDFNKPTSFAGAINIYSHIENFFNFIFSTPHSTHIFTSSNLKKKGKDIPLYILSPSRKKNYERKDVKPGSAMLFSWGDVENRDDVFIKWILEYDRIKEIVDALILLRSTVVSEEMRFTTLINSLETVHRRYFNKKKQTDEEFQKRVDDIVENLTDDDKKLVRDSLRYKNEMTLRLRLNEIYKIGELLGIKKPAKKFRNKILETRNYLTHGDEERKAKALSNYELYKANSLLGKYVKIILLVNLGVKAEDLRKIVEKSPQFKYTYRDEPPQIDRYGFF